jgi:hypothetical protein
VQVILDVLPVHFEFGCACDEKLQNLRRLSFLLQNGEGEGERGVSKNLTVISAVGIANDTSLLGTLVECGCETCGGKCFC